MRTFWLALLLVLCPALHAQAQPSRGAARLAFEHARALDDFDSFTIEAPVAPIRGYMEALFSSIGRANHRAATAADRYSAVVRHGEPIWTVASFVAIGRIYEALADGLRQGPPAPLALRPDSTVDLVQTLQTELDRQAARAECTAISQYALAAGHARARRIDTQDGRTAMDRLEHYGDRIGQCASGELSQIMRDLLDETASLVSARNPG